MVRLLASVVSVAEARIAVEAGADLIDCKDPSQGALGALPAETVRAIVAAVGGARPVSATLGDLPMDPGTLAAAAQAVAATGVDYVKVGLFPSPAQRACINALAPVAARHRLIAVLFADLNPDFALLDDIAAAGLAGTMLDTADKSRGGLRRHLPAPRLAAFAAAARARGLLVGLAGSLAVEDVTTLTALGPDYLGFRGALCTGGRQGALDPARLAGIVEALAAASGRAPLSGVRQLSVAG